jgi:DNA polymerase-3 subunit epsilon
MRHIVLDTETTGLDPKDGHRIIEIGCVEMIDRRLTGNNYHVYLQPDRQVDEGAIEVHGITNEFLADKPRFADVAQEFIDYLRGAELIIHNAPFDVGFINAELERLGPAWGRVEDYCTVTDSLALARELHPGQRNSLDALCKRYEVDNSHRELHGALLDSEILADVYLLMTGGQVSLALDSPLEAASNGPAEERIGLDGERPALRIANVSDAEREAHEACLDAIEKAGGGCVWRRIGADRGMG